MKDRTWVIANPAAGRGISVKTIATLRADFEARGATEVHETAAAGEEVTLAERALERGAQTIVVVGGDGTCTGVAQAILTSKQPCRLAVVPVGTGNDFAKTLGVTKLSPGAIADLIERKDTTISIDVGRADGRYYLNSCGFGFDASVLEASNRVRFLKGDAVYIYAALGQLFTYRGSEVSVRGVPGVTRGPMLMVTVSNGQFLGGAFKIAPSASVIDGKLDVCFVSDSNIPARVKVFVGAMRGTHIGMPSVSAATVERFALTFPAAPPMEMDGELRVARSRTVELQCVPRALSVVAAPGAIV